MLSEETMMTVNTLTRTLVKPSKLPVNILDITTGLTEVFTVYYLIYAQKSQTPTALLKIETMSDYVVDKNAKIDTKYVVYGAYKNNVNDSEKSLKLLGFQARRQTQDIVWIRRNNNNNWRKHF